jgi:acetyl-CoA carboxylase carboxyl transferase subunit beta
MMEDLFKERKEKLNLFKALLPKTKEAPKPAQNNVPEGLYTKCPNCQRDMLSQQMKANLYVCPECGCHMRVTAWDRIEMLVDPDSFREIRPKLRTKNALGFPGYNQKLYHLEKATGLNDAVITGLARIDGHRVVLGVMDCRFMMGSMGSVVGEKITRAIEYATRKGLPVIMFCASGGARMQEGIISLMQMSKTSNAVARHNAAGLLYISYLTDPTTGGVSASFGSLGDITLAEPKALIGFAGPRVIEQTIKQKLPEGFQQAEFQQQQGFVDQVVERKHMKSTIALLIKLHAKEVR